MGKRELQLTHSYYTYLNSDALVGCRDEAVGALQLFLDVPEDVVVRGCRHPAVLRRRQAVVRGRARRVGGRRAFVELCHPNKLLPLIYNYYNISLMLGNSYIIIKKL